MAARRREYPLLERVLRVLILTVERVGFPERKASSKEANQVKRESAIKEALVRADGCVNDGMLPMSVVW